MQASSNPAPTAKRPLSLVRGGPSSLMVIQLARLGDFLQTTPLLAALRAAHPQARLGVAVAPAVLPLARACRYVDQAYSLDPALLQDAAGATGPRGLALARLRGLCAPLWNDGFEEIYNLNLSHLAAGLAAGWSGARLRGWRPDTQGGLSGEAWTPFVMQMVADRRLTRLHLCDILASYAAPDGPPLTRLDQRVEPQALNAARQLAPAGPRVVLQLGANHDLRRWPLESFAQLARGLAGQGACLLLTGAAGERPLGARLAQALGPGAPLIDLMGQTDLPTLSGVLAAADLVVSADTGTLHLASAVGAKVLALYMGPAQAHETGPYGPGHLVLQARDSCGPCLEDRPVCQGQAPCRRLISPQAALLAATRLLQGAGADLAAAGLDLPPGVEPLAGEMDGFGQRYRPLLPRPLEVADGLALALRQAGRRLLRPAQTGGQTCRQELRAEHLPPAPEHRPALAGLSKAAEALARACAQGDSIAAGRLLAQAPGLAPLARLVGPAPPPGLEAACLAAAEVLQTAASL